MQRLKRSEFGCDLLIVTPRFLYDLHVIRILGASTPDIRYQIRYAGAHFALLGT